jgi:hypothetical protein
MRSERAAYKPKPSSFRSPAASPAPVVCEIPGEAHFCQPIAFGLPTTASVRTGAGGPQPPREGSNKTTYGMREVGTELRERWHSSA